MMAPIIRLELPSCASYLLLIGCLVIFETSKATRITPARIGNDYGSENLKLDRSGLSFDANFEHQADGTEEDDIQAPQLDEGSSRIAGGGFPGCGKAPLNQLTPSEQPEEYIIGGKSLEYGEFPQYVRLIIDYGDGINDCGGTLVSNQHVLTVAHCIITDGIVASPESTKVILGEHRPKYTDENEVQVIASDICVPDDYQEEDSRNDWALVTLSEPVQFTDYIQPACLPFEEQFVPTYGRKSKCFLVGLGAIEVLESGDDSKTPVLKYPDVINKLQVENVACKSSDFGNIDSDRVCYTKVKRPGGSGCIGDSGGPVVCLDEQRRWTLMGGSSYGSSDCDIRFENVYFRVRTLLPEIKRKCGVNLLEPEI